MDRGKRIVITGMGTKNAIGGNVSEFARSLEEGVLASLRSIFLTPRSFARIRGDR